MGVICSCICLYTVLIGFGLVLTTNKNKGNLHDYVICWMFQYNTKWVVLFNLVKAGHLRFLAIFHNLAANLYGFLLKTNKILINTTKSSRFFNFG